MDLITLVLHALLAATPQSDSRPSATADLDRELDKLCSSDPEVWKPAYELLKSDDRISPAHLSAKLANSTAAFRPRLESLIRDKTLIVKVVNRLGARIPTLKTAIRSGAERGWGDAFLQIMEHFDHDHVYPEDLLDPDVESLAAHAVTNAWHSSSLRSTLLPRLLDDAGREGYRNLEPILKEIMEHGSAYERTAAVNALGRQNRREVALVAAKALRDPEDGVRSAAIFALGRLRNPVVGEDLLEFLWNSPPNPTREPHRVVNALWQLGDVRWAPVLRNELKSDDSSRVEEAAIGLGHLGGREDLNKLEELLRHQSIMRRYGALRGLSLLYTPADYAQKGTLMRQMLEDRSPEVRAQAVDALASMNPPMADLVRSLDDSDVGVKVASIGALSAYPEAMETLRPFLSSDKPDLRKAAIASLSKSSKQKLAAGWLKPLLLDANPDISAYAKMALCTLGDRVGAGVASSSKRFYLLNGIRAPQVTGLLMTTRIRVRLTDSWGHALNRVGEASGLKVADFSSRVRVPEALSLSDSLRSLANRPWVSCWDVLECLSGSSVSFLVAEGSVTIRSADEVEAHLKDWLQQQ